MRFAPCLAALALLLAACAAQDTGVLRLDYEADYHAGDPPRTTLGAVAWNQPVPQRRFPLPPAYWMRVTPPRHALARPALFLYTEATAVEAWQGDTRLAVSGTNTPAGIVGWRAVRFDPADARPVHLRLVFRGDHGLRPHRLLLAEGASLPVLEERHSAVSLFRLDMQSRYARPADDAPAAWREVRGRENKWHSRFDLQRTTVPSARDLWHRVTLPGTTMRRPVLYLYGNLEAFDLLVDGVAVRSFRRDAAGLADGAHYLWHAVPMPPATASGELALRIPRADNWARLSVYALAEDGSFGSLFDEYRQSQRLEERLVGSTLGLMLFAVGALSLAVFCARIRRREYPLLSLGGAFTLLGLLSQTSNPVVFMVTSVPYETLQYVNFVCYRFGLAFLVAFFAQTFAVGAWKTALTWTWRIHTALALALSGLFVSGVLYSLFPGFIDRVPLSLLTGLELFLIAGAFIHYVRTRLVRERPPVYVHVAVGLFVAVALWTLSESPERQFTLATALPLAAYLVLAAALGAEVVRRLNRRENEHDALRRELDTARHIQAALLPRAFPALPRVTVSGLCLPMTEVGGDYYDFIVHAGRTLAALVADVSGHGVPAALIASMVKATWTPLAAAGVPPQSVLEGLNRSLYGRIENQFLTAGALELDTTTLRLDYASAAHPPLLVHRRSTGEIREVKPRGSIIGFAYESPFRQTSLELVAGDRVLLCTDGLLEATDERDEEFGDAALGRFLQSGAALPTHDFCHRLVDALVAWHGSRDHLPDDVTLVVIDVGA